MMNSKKLECTPRRHFRDRSPREWGDQDDRWNEAQGCRSNASRDSHRTYYGEHPSEADGTKEKRQYGGSPQRAYGKEPFSHDRNRRSPARRCVTPDQGGGGGGDGDYARFRYSSPETCTSQEHRVAERRKSLTGDAEDYFKHRRLDSDFSPALSKSVTEQATRSDGFQRFLSVLNKGVDVNMLTKIVPCGDRPDPQIPSDLAWTRVHARRHQTVAS
ncbi:unnamed protein product [Merluccius merluccius]